MSNSDYWEPARNPFRILIHSQDEYRAGEMVWTQWGGEYECLYQAVGYARSGLPTRGAKRFVMVEERKPDPRVGLDNYRLITLWEGHRIPEWFGIAVHTSHAAGLRIRDYTPQASASGTKGTGGEHRSRPGRGSPEEPAT